MKHSEKRKLATHLRSRLEVQAHTPIFETKNWMIRKVSRENKEMGKRK